MDPLDDPVGAALDGPHAHLADRHGDARRYPLDVSPFAAPRGWDDLATLVGPGGTATLTGEHLEVPAGWEQVWRLPGVQLVAGDLHPGHPGRPAGPVTPAEVTTELLTDDDVPAMLDLVARTRPGPFLPRTTSLGRYVGVRDHGVLVAMAGERLRPPGWTEISAVCTAPEYRGRGLGTRLILDVAAAIRARGDAVFLHTVAANTVAIRLYESMGFRLRSHPSFLTVRAIGNTDGAPRTEQGATTASRMTRSAHP